MKTLENFLQDWDARCRDSYGAVPLFAATDPLSAEQKRSFGFLFYHARGHFYKFLWMLGSFAPSKQTKDEIIENIREEFSGDYPSHEQLYFRFCKEIGISEDELRSEILAPQHECPFLKEFNDGHLTFLLQHGWASNKSAFLAYERLDNLDYGCLLALVKNRFLISDTDALRFFDVHQRAQHLDARAPVFNLFGIKTERTSWRRSTSSSSANRRCGGI